MPTFITIATFTFPSEMYSARALLETEGIECFVKDELTAQVHNFYSQAIGGVKLQVKEADAERAKRLLIQAGYIKEESHELSGFWKKVDQLTRKIPRIKKLGVEARLFSVVATVLISGLFLFLLGSLVYGFITQKERTPVPIEEQLVYQDWCVSHITFKDKHFVPYSSDKIIYIAGLCHENMDFEGNGKIRLPGFESKTVIGKWRIEDGLLHISQTDTFEFVYDGQFRIEEDGMVTRFISPTTTIHTTHKR